MWQGRRRLRPPGCVDSATRAQLYSHSHAARPSQPAQRMRLSAPSYCVFCEIIAGRSPARVRYLDNEIIVIVNKLTWVPLMLLVMPKQHMQQGEMWSSGLMGRLGKVAVDMGWWLAPNGFRVLSNFGRDGMQSQSHGHLHVIGGVHLGEYA